MEMARSKCACCGWVFDVCALPMPVRTAAAVMIAAHCPMCGHHDGNLWADPRPLTDQEAAHKRDIKVRAAPSPQPREAVNGAKSYDEFLAALPKAMARMDATAFVETLASAMAIARGLGSVDTNTHSRG